MAPVETAGGALATQLAAANERDDEKERRDAAAADAAELRQRLQRSEARASENEAEANRLGDRAGAALRRLTQSQSSEVVALR